jgi:hypothetical protein
MVPLELERSRRLLCLEIDHYVSNLGPIDAAMGKLRLEHRWSLVSTCRDGCTNSATDGLVNSLFK